MLDSPRLQGETLEERAYQVNIARACLERSTLVVLPTGMGKTVVALLVIARVLQEDRGRVLLLAPTKPLVEQHAAFLRTHLDASVELMTGEVAPVDREWIWTHHDVIVSTPQVVRNDLRTDRAALESVALLIFDEAHRAVGDYAYVDVGARYKARDGLVLGTTASPGSDPERILEVCAHLGIEAVEIRTEFDPDVVNYLHDVRVEQVRVAMPPSTRRIRDLLRGAYDGVAASLRERGFLTDRRRATVRDILAVQREVQRRLGRGEKNYHLYQAASAAAVALRLNHAIVLVETQGLVAFRQYAKKLEEEARAADSSKASKALLKMPKVHEALKLARVTQPEDAKVPKVIEKLGAEFRTRPKAKAIVFTHFRDTADRVVQALQQEVWARPFRFVGQADRGADAGLSQKEQAARIEAFKAGTTNIMVATSVAEEGLDIPSTDLVIFYEPIPSEIRTIQRRGRTGRNRPGRVVVLVTKDSRDEAYLYSAMRKERKMHQELDRLRELLKQRILVGKPGGGFFQAPKLSEASARALALGEEAEEEVARPPFRRKQASLSDYDET